MRWIAADDAFDAGTCIDFHFVSACAWKRGGGSATTGRGQWEECASTNTFIVCTVCGLGLAIEMVRGSQVIVINWIGGNLVGIPLLIRISMSFVGFGG